MASKKPSPRAEEQRRQTRLAVSQSARMILDAGQEIVCEITDFCLGGLFLRFAHPVQDCQSVKGREGISLRIAFTTPTAVGAQAFDFAARLVRQSESGVGVAFEETPVTALLALNKVAAFLRSQKVDIKPYGGANAGELKQACKARYRQAIESGFARLGERLVPRLEEAKASAKTDVEQFDLMDGIRLIPSALGDVRARCLARSLGGLESLCMGRATDEVYESELALVEKEEIEDWISITAVSNKLADRFSHELGILQLRLEQIFGLTLDAANNPFLPSQICNDFRWAFAELRLPLSVRLIVDSALYDALGEPLAELYRNMLAMLPEVEGEKQLAAGSKPETAPAATQREVPKTLGGVANSLMEHVRHGRIAPKTDGALHDSALKLLRQLIASGRIPVARQAEATASANVFGELLGALSVEKSVPAEVLPQFMRLEDVLGRLALMDPAYLNDSAHPAHAALNAMDRLSLASSDEGRIDDVRVLDHISQWVDRIHNEAEANPAVFEAVREQAETALQPLMKERGARIAKLQAALEGWQKTGQANRRVLQQLEARVAGKRVPTLVLDLFATGWRNYLIRVMLRQGAGSEAEAEAWQVVDNLLAWLDPERGGQPAYQDVQHLLKTVDARLKLVCADRDSQDRLLERLTDVLLKQGEAAYRSVAGILPGQPESTGEAAPDEDDLLDSFRVGDWVSFDGMPVPLNLIWIGDDPESYVFCNYKGVKKLELARDEFVQRIASGQAKLADNLDLPLMERSFSSMIQRIHQNLLKQATVDEKTGLVERREFMRRARGSLLHPASAGADGAVCRQVMGVLDVESLRVLRSRLGAEGYAGLARALAGHLEKTLDSGLLTHSAEYTFAFMLPVVDLEQMQSAGEKIISEVGQFSFKWGGGTYALSANLGLVCAGASQDPEDLYNRAEEACLEAKHRGRNQMVLRHAEEDEAGGLSRLDYWSGRLAEVLRGGHLFLRCQPIVATAGEAGGISHYEILLGVNPGQGKPVNIGEMMAAMEQLRRATEIDRWVVSSVLAWMRDNPERLENIKGLSVNLSAQSINSRNFLEFVSAELDQAGAFGGKLIFEITESAAIDSFAHAERFIRQLRRYGCRFALDDFGVGFASFSYLKNLKVDYLKIDGSFVRNMSQNEVDVALVSSMHETSRFLGIQTIAEVVENQETLDILKRIGVDYAQGYFTGKPMPIAQLTA